MSIKSIQKQNVVNEIYDQISSKLLDGSWAPGSRLPSEAELTTSFNVSRVSVRSAVQRFRDLGIVVTRQGSGSYVSENFTPQMLSNDPRPIMHLSREEFHDMMIFVRPWSSNAWSSPSHTPPMMTFASSRKH